MKALRLLGVGIGFAVAVALWPLALGVAVSLFILAGLNRTAGPAPLPPEPVPERPSEPLLGNLRRQELAKVAERNREHLEVCYLMSECD